MEIEVVLQVSRSTKSGSVYRDGDPITFVTIMLLHAHPPVLHEGVYC